MDPSKVDEILDKAARIAYDELSAASESEEPITLVNCRTALQGNPVFGNDYRARLENAYSLHTHGNDNRDFTAKVRKTDHCFEYESETVGFRPMKNGILLTPNAFDVILNGIKEN